MKTTTCAGKCGATVPRADGHAAGWRALCEECRKAGRSCWFDQVIFGQTLLVKDPNENFGT